MANQAPASIWEQANEAVALFYDGFADSTEILPYLEDCRVTDNFRRNFCVYPESCLKASGVRFEDLPTESIEAAHQYMDSRIQSSWSDQTNLYNEMVEMLWKPKAESREVMDADTIKRFAQHMYDSAKNFYLRDKTITAYNVVDEMRMVIEGRYENHEEILKEFIKIVAVPLLQEVYAEYIRLSGECEWNDRPEPQEMAVKMKKAIATLELLAMDEPKQSQYRQ